MEHNCKVTSLDGNIIGNEMYFYQVQDGQFATK
jgi:hypothetical protein